MLGFLERRKKLLLQFGKTLLGVQALCEKVNSLSFTKALAMNLAFNKPSYDHWRDRLEQKILSNLIYGKLKLLDDSILLAEYPSFKYNEINHTVMTKKTPYVLLDKPEYYVLDNELCLLAIVNSLNYHELLDVMYKERDELRGINSNAKIFFYTINIVSGVFLDPYADSLSVLDIGMPIMLRFAIARAGKVHNETNI